MRIIIDANGFYQLTDRNVTWQAAPTTKKAKHAMVDWGMNECWMWVTVATIAISNDLSVQLF
jgi:hypothetical protein